MSSGMTPPLERSTPAASNAAPPFFRRHRWGARLVLLFVVFAGSLKAGDLLVGWLADSQERHLLRLYPNRSIRHRTNEFDYTFRTNALGLRGPDVEFSPPAGVRRIIVLGDSFVAGYGVSDDEILTSQLERLLNGVAATPGASGSSIDAQRGEPRSAGDSEAAKDQVINVGRVGTSTIRECDLYERLGRRFHPELVVLCYYLGNDLAEVVSEKTPEEIAAWTPDGRVRRLAFSWMPNLYVELAMLRRRRDQQREMEVRTEEEILDNLRREAIARQVDPQAAVNRYRALPAKLRRDVEKGGLAEQRTTDSCLEPDRLVRALDPDDDFVARAWPRTELYLDRLKAAV